MYNGNFDITRILDQSNLTTQRCRLIFWVECTVGGYLVLARTIGGNLLVENWGAGGKVTRDVKSTQKF
jgi:hypothetical protein